MPPKLTFKLNHKQPSTGTSVEALAKLYKKLGRQQQLVFDVVENAKHQGVTSDEIAAELGWLVYEVRPRTSELRQNGRIVDSGRRRKSASGNFITVWVLAAYGQNAGGTGHA